MKFRTETFDCECHSFDHSIRFAFDPEEEDVRCLEIWVDAHFPQNRSWWQRLVISAKYLFGTGTLDYSYGSWILKHEDEARLRAFLREYDLAVWKLRAEQLNVEKRKGQNASIEKDSV